MNYSCSYPHCWRSQPLPHGALRKQKNALLGERIFKKWTRWSLFCIYHYAPFKININNYNLETFDWLKLLFALFWCRCTWSLNHWCHTLTLCLLGGFWFCGYRQEGTTWGSFLCKAFSKIALSPPTGGDVNSWNVLLPVWAPDFPASCAAGGFHS